MLCHGIQTFGTPHSRDLRAVDSFSPHDRHLSGKSLRLSVVKLLVPADPARISSSTIEAIDLDNGISTSCLGVTPTVAS